MPATGAMFARNPWNTAFGSRVAFADMRGRADRLDRRPARIHRPQRHAGEPGGAGERGAAVQRGRRRRSTPARAMRTTLELPPDGVAEIVFFLGEAPTREEARVA